MAETIQVVLSDLGAGMQTPVTVSLILGGGINICNATLWADNPKPPGDIGAFALRAPENIIRSECGKEIDIWAIGCMVCGDTQLPFVAFMAC